jgi:hypothetical protein
MAFCIKSQEICEIWMNDLFLSKGSEDRLDISSGFDSCKILQ